MKIKELVDNGDIKTARKIQNTADRIIYEMCACHGNLYAVMKEILKMNGLELGGVRKPLPGIVKEDLPQIKKCKELIDEAIKNL